MIVVWMAEINDQRSLSLSGFRAVASVLKHKPRRPELHNDVKLAHPTRGATSGAKNETHQHPYSGPSGSFHLRLPQQHGLRGLCDHT